MTSGFFQTGPKKAIRFIQDFLEVCKGTEGMIHGVIISRNQDYTV